MRLYTLPPPPPAKRDPPPYALGWLADPISGPACQRLPVSDSVGTLPWQHRGSARFLHV